MTASFAFWISMPIGTTHECSVGADHRPLLRPQGRRMSSIEARVRREQKKLTEEIARLESARELSLSVVEERLRVVGTAGTACFHARALLSNTRSRVPNAVDALPCASQSCGLRILLVHAGDVPQAS